MIFGKLICWIARKRGGKHKYPTVMVQGLKSENPTAVFKTCIRCGHVKRSRKLAELKAVA